MLQRRGNTVDGENAIEGQLIGQSIERVEDLSLLRDTAAFMDDLPTGAATLYAAYALPGVAAALDVAAALRDAESKSQEK